MAGETERTGLAHRVRALPWLTARAPRWLCIVAGLALVAAGLWLLVRPLSSLEILGWYVGISCVASGIADLTLSHVGAAEEDERSHSDLITGALWIGAGLVILAWVGRQVDLLGPLVCAVLIGSGLIAIARLATGRNAGRWLAATFGVAEVLFGLIGLLWPDVTLVVIAVLFGGRTAAFGATLLRRGLLGSPVTVPAATGRWRVAVQWTSAVVVVALAGTTLYVGHVFRHGKPVADAFYDAPARLVDEPGHLVRWERYTGKVPAGMSGYRILYVTTDANDRSILASAVLAVPTEAKRPAPLIDWAHGTVGVARGCAPSIGSDALIGEGLPSLEALVRNGWAIVATDYPGMGTEGNFPYLIGEGEGRSVLDAARAARQLPGVELADETVIWGHSQGGHAALWAGQLAPTYAPDVRVRGTAALSPASDPAALAETVLSHPGALGASLAVSFVADSYTRYYDNLDLEEVVVGSARTLVREAAARCTTELGTLATILTGLAVAKDQPIVRPSALDGDFGKRLEENKPTGPWSAPLLIAHGESDEVVPYAINQRYAAQLQRAGAVVNLIGYPGETHLSILAPDSPLNDRLEAWTAARFAD